MKINTRAIFQTICLLFQKHDKDKKYNFCRRWKRMSWVENDTYNQNKPIHCVLLCKENLFFFNMWQLLQTTIPIFSWNRSKEDKISNNKKERFKTSRMVSEGIKKRAIILYQIEMCKFDAPTGYCHVLRFLPLWQT